MPPYSLEIAASLLAFLNDSMVLDFIPNSISEVSVNDRLLPNQAVNTSAAAADIVAWPLVYEGKGGVCMYGRQVSVINLLITVSGLTVFVLYLVSQQLIKLSNKLIAVCVYAATVVLKSAWAFWLLCLQYSTNGREAKTF